MLQVTVTATDDASNEATCTFTVNVEDTGQPIIACPAAITVNASTVGPVTTVSWETPATSDNWGVDSVTSDIADGSNFSIGLQTIVYTVVDKAGLRATCSFAVTVKDVTAPVIVCPSDMNISTDQGEAYGMIVRHEPDEFLRPLVAFRHGAVDCTSDNR